MEEKHSNIKLNHLDLAKRKFELDDIFDSVINRIPDLCMPSAFRLAGEDDFFNKTKDIKLVHFRKQRDFSGCISPNSAEQSTSVSCRNIARPTIIQSPQDGEDKRRKSGYICKSKHDFESPTRRVKFSFRQEDFDNQEAEEEDKERHENLRHNNKKVELHNDPVQRWNFRSTNIRDNKSLDECRSRLEMRNKLKKRYSSIKIKMNNYNSEEEYRIGYDRLFRKKPEANYPFANPIAECMLTEDNIDNLREIIVSALNIEWKMLTPVRPNSDYEEKYFDKLIALHRDRYKSRLESGYFEINQKIPFKHTRHPFVMQIGSRRRDRSSLSSADRKEKRENDSSKQSSNFKMTIPTLTLTSDEKSSEPIINSDEEFSDDMQEFDYESFSRFSLNNMRKLIKIRSPQDSNEEQTVVVGRTIGLDSNDLEFANRQDMNFMQSEDESLEDQVESIISHLMNNNLTDI